MLTIMNGSRTYLSESGLTPALRNVNIQIGDGETLALTGPSGSGKSSLLKCLALLDQLDQGSILLDGQRVDKLSENQKAAIRGKNFGFIFQHSHLIPVLNVLENVLLPVGMRGGDMNAARGRALELLSKLNLSEHLRKNVRQLSGGQQQRVAIARALVSPVRYIFADEPTAHLDSANGRIVLDLLIELARSENASLVLCTHDDRHAALMQRQVRLEDGKVLDDLDRRGHFA